MSTVLVTGRSQSCVLVWERLGWRCCITVCGLFLLWVNGVICGWDWSVGHYTVGALPWP